MPPFTSPSTYIDVTCYSFTNVPQPEYQKIGTHFFEEMGSNIKSHKEVDEVWGRLRCPSLLPIPHNYL